jgi:hypothetical protein
MNYVKTGAEIASARSLWTSDFLVDNATRGNTGFGGKEKSGQPKLVLGEKSGQPKLVLGGLEARRIQTGAWPSTTGGVWGVVWTGWLKAVAFRLNGWLNAN